MMHQTLEAVSTSATKPQVKAMKYLLSFNMIKVCISSLLLLSGFNVQAQRDTLQSKMNTLHHAHFSDATPKLWLNLTASRTISFGLFAKDDCSEPQRAFDFTESKGGFAGRGVFFEASLGVRIKGNLGLLLKTSHQQINVVHRAIRQKLEADGNSVAWEINTWVWKINTFALGLTSWKSLGRRNRYLVGWQALAGLSHSSRPRLDIQGVDSIGRYFSYQLQYGRTLKKVPAPSVLLGGYIGYRPVRNFALLANIDLFVSRVTFKNPISGTIYSRIDPMKGKTYWITTLLPGLQLSFFLP